MNGPTRETARYDGNGPTRETARHGKRPDTGNGPTRETARHGVGPYTRPVRVLSRCSG